MVNTEPAVRMTDTYTEPDFVRVQTWADAAGNGGWLATIEHFSYRPADDDERSGWRCMTVAEAEAMSREDALFIARSYAQQNGIPVVYDADGDE